MVKAFENRYVHVDRESNNMKNVLTLKFNKGRFSLPLSFLA
jgi:hypothetical protein